MEEDGAIQGVLLCEDRAGSGRLLVSTLDPFYHHGGGCIPQATRFLYALLDWLAEGS